MRIFTNWAEVRQLTHAVVHSSEVDRRTVESSRVEWAPLARRSAPVATKAMERHG